ncbi:chymotrypsin-2-like [Symsagittifera roscoffensis]|uniref:chymotrypsin-2-like n=1 Tax=Symsagittifera roscoffensis TaxID=84072 RepID=UPI00307BA7BF
MDTLLILITSTSILFSAQFSYSVPVSEDVRDRWSDGPVNLTDSLVSEIVNGIRSGTRLFYVRLRLPPPRGFCGGSIIDPQWVLTSTKCLDLFITDEIVVEIGDFSMPFSRKIMSEVSAIYAAPGYRSGPTPANDMALVKLTRRVPEEFRIPMCRQEQVPHSVMLGTVGMGATVSRGKLLESIPNSLREIFLRESRGRFPTSWRPFSIQFCPDYNICTEPITEGSNICMFDYGGPLYKFECASTTPNCLYGVASFSTNRLDRPDEMCNGGSTFTSVPHFFEWISGTMASG